MLTTLKNVLNCYTDEELKNMDLFINSENEISNIIIDEWSIDLITKDTEIKIDNYVTKEGK